MAIISSKLSYAVRMPVLAKYLGLLAFMLALLTLVPLVAAMLFEDFHIALRYLVVIAVLMILWNVSRSIVEPRHIQTNEALTIVALAFILSPLLMTVPFMGSGLTFYNALFEAVSAVTTTGLTVTSELAGKSQTFLFSRAWMQWYGGLGIIVLSVALLMGSQISSRSLSVPLGGETLATTTRTHARQMLFIYSSLTLAGIAVVWLITGSGMMAVNHVLAAVSTGGFSSFDNSLAGIESWYSRFAIMGFGLCGALPLSLYAVTCSKNWRKGIQDTELHALLVAVVVVALLLLVSFGLHSGMQFGEAAGHALSLAIRSEEHTSELQSPDPLVCRRLLEKKKERNNELTASIRDPSTAASIVHQNYP